MCSALAAATAASIAAPLAIENPNFTSSCAVAIDSWVCAEIPGVSRSKTDCRFPNFPAIALIRSISIRESATIYRTPQFIASVISSNDLLFPCSSIRSGGNFAARATANSPPVQTSIFNPSSINHLHVAIEVKALLA